MLALRQSPDWPTNNKHIVESQSADIRYINKCHNDSVVVLRLKNRFVDFKYNYTHVQ